MRNYLTLSDFGDSDNAEEPERFRLSVNLQPPTAAERVSGLMVAGLALGFLLVLMSD